MALAIRGTIVRLAKSRPKDVFPGVVYVTDEGSIASVKRHGAAPPTGYAGVARIDVGDAFVYPGLIDLHSHLGYNSLPLWVHPGEPKPFLHHDIWPGRSSYKPKVSWPAWVMAKAAPEALMVYVQVRALAGGTSAIQGWPAANRRPVNQLLRNADDQRFFDEHDGRDNIRTSTLTLGLDELKSRADDLAAGMGFIYHCAEGQLNSKVVREFGDLATSNCLRERLIAIHCCALGEPEFARWKERARIAKDREPGSVVWSPFSNLWLYGHTTDVVAARRHGINVCLGSDWGPSGTKNLLGELKVARLWADSQSWDLDDFDLVEMVTAAPGDALAKCWDKKVGRLVRGARADLTIVERRMDDPWANLVAAREEQVQLVLIDGEPRYGTHELMSAAGARDTTSVRVGSVRRRVSLIDPEDKALPSDQQRPWTFQAVLEAMEAVRRDPSAAVENPTGLFAASGQSPSALGAADDPLLLDLDMPGSPHALAGPPPQGVTVEIPEVPSLRHDRDWLRDVRRPGLSNPGAYHQKVLDSLERFY